MASPLEPVQDFAAAATRLSSLAELEAAVSATIRPLGADHFLMIHHADFSHGRAGLVRVGTYPESFIDISRQDGRPLDDPVMDACERSIAGFFWDEAAAMVRLTARHRQRAEAVRRTGLGDGFVVPTNIPGEPLGSCHFAAASGRRIPRRNSGLLQLLGIWGFEAARRLTPGARPRPRVDLTERQRVCIVLAARGKSDSVIGQLLGLRPKTVNSYIEAAKTRYGVATRNQLIVCALFGSEISFLDIV